MSDFFTRLAERTLGLALIIQPIKPSLFAPEPHADSEMPFEIREEGVSTQVFSGAPTAATQTSHRIDSGGTPEMAQPEHAQAGQPRPAATPARASTGVPPAEMPPTSQAGPHRPAQVVHRSMLTEPPRAVHTRELRVGQDTLVHSAAEPFPLQSILTGGPSAGQSVPSYYAAEPSPSQSILTRESSLPVDAIESIAPQFSPHTQREAISQTHPGSRDGSLPSPHVEQETDSTGADRKREPLAMHTAAFQDPAMPRHTFLGKRSTRGTQSPPAAQPVPTHSGMMPPEPTIQVTIGRIEVRAINTPTTSARTQQQPTRSPVMSLDEYLRRQEQGGRQ